VSPVLVNSNPAALAIGQVLNVYNWSTLAVITYDDYRMNTRLRDSLSLLTKNGKIGWNQICFHAFCSKRYDRHQCVRVGCGLGRPRPTGRKIDAGEKCIQKCVELLHVVNVFPFTVLIMGLGIDYCDPVSVVVMASAWRVGLLTSDFVTAD